MFLIRVEQIEYNLREDFEVYAYYLICAAELNLLASDATCKVPTQRPVYCAEQSKQVLR